MKKTVSILGCGWLGTALGKKLLRHNIIVKGSTQSVERYNELEMTGIQPYFLKVGPDLLDIDYANFFNTDVLIIAIPPKRIDDIETVFPLQIKQIIQYIKNLKIGNVLFISSTSVFEGINKEVVEGEEGNPEKASGKALLKAEKLLTELGGVDTTVIRFGGLIGANRNPASFLIGKAKVNGSLPVNLIHRNDCVDIIQDIIEKEIWGEVFNACSPEHPTKKEFYTKAAKISELPHPRFTEEARNYKIVNSDKLIRKLSYSFHYPSPMDYLKEIEEWAYRI